MLVFLKFIFKNVLVKRGYTLVCDGDCVKLYGLGLVLACNQNMNKES